jgi:uncharacterized protein (TIGR02646 family)
MRTIDKSGEPRSLTEHRLKPYSDYDNYNDKDALRRALVKEQHGLCCYCMGRIRSEEASMKIEHWQCQAQYPACQLNYRNMLGACMGGEGQPSNLQHCDTKKGDRDLLLNPADRGHHIETRLRYEPDGSIRSDNEAINDQLNNILNLNLPSLKNGRKAILDAFMDSLSHEKKKIRGKVPRDWFESKRDRLIGRTGDFEPYCQVAVWWLDRGLAKMQE